MKRLIYILFALLSVGVGVSSAQNLELPDESAAFAKVVSSSFQSSHSWDVNEKIYIQTDKPYYDAGETIWFKAYLMNSTTHKEVSKSKFVYVELIDKRDSLYARVKIKADKYGFHNNISLSSDMPAGDYTLRAYTQRMRNWSEDQFFHRNISIANNVAASSPKKRSGKIDVQFLPESGVLMAGEPQTIAFKAIGEDGLSRDIEGVIYGEQSGEISYIKSDFKGMGRMSLSAEAEDSYYAMVNEVGSPTAKYRVELPKPVTSGCTIKAVVSGNYLLYQIVVSDDLDYNKIGVVIHSYGDIVTSRLLSTPTDIVRVPITELPEGLLTIALVNSVESTPIAERLVFIPQRSRLLAKITPDKARYEARSRVDFDINIMDNKTPVAGSFAISVTDRSAVDVSRSKENIVSEIVLSSHLKGYIEGATDYFTDNELQDRYNLDLLMLTHGWSRFSLSDVLKRRSKKIKIPAEENQVLSGDVKGVLDGENNKARLTIIYPQRDTFEVVSLDDRGRFSVSYDDLPDSTEMIIQAMGRRGETAVAINITPDDLPEPRYSYPKHPTEIRHADVKQVKEVVVEVQENTKIAPTFGETSPFSISEEVIDQYSGETIHDLIKQLPGVTLSADSISVASVDLLGAPIEGRAKIYLNNVEIELEYISMLLADQVASIDLVKSVVDAATYSDVDAPIGVLTINLKEGVGVLEDLRPLESIHVKNKLGYKRSVEYYQPKYEVTEVYRDKTPDLRTTLCWEPRIKIGKDGRAKVSFYTSDRASTYDIVLEGITADGHPVHYKGAIVCQ